MTDNSIKLSQKISRFLAKAESDQQALALDPVNFSQYFEEKESAINNILSPFLDEINHLKDHLTQQSTELWHEETEQLLHYNQLEIASISSLYHETSTHITAQCHHLNQVTMSAVKSAAQFFISVKNNSLQKLAERKYQELEKSFENNLSQVKNIVHTLRWKSMATALCLSLAVSFIVSFYMDNESPWAAHKQVMQQRQAGKVLLASWQHLSSYDRNIITQNM